jgi:uncharacterized membrane protein YsdA (DUF1294 family)
MYFEQILLGIFVAINIFAFLMMANDKRKSIRGGNTERIPEGLIFFLATIFGSVGVYAGMILFRHKTKRWYFQLGIPLLIVQNLATLYVLKEMIGSMQ